MNFHYKCKYAVYLFIFILITHHLLYNEFIEFTEKEAHAFKSGYETIMSIPHLEEYRQPYRYLYRLLSVQGNVELKKWLSHPSYF
ncbi:hypothetical protein BCACH14_33130 [Bacillus cereus]|nr:hypothetical protein BCACH14_33130 [Bacillus cereus]